MINRYPSAFSKTIYIVISLVILNACSSRQSILSTNAVDSQTESTRSNQSALALTLCNMAVSNPPHSINNRVSRNSPVACVENIELLVAPAPAACLSSGFGSRYGRDHRGVDFQSRPSGDVIASGAGTVILVDFRQKDYGHWVIVDHGKGVYTSYSHLEYVNSAVVKGTRIKKGQVVGKMGRSGNAAHAIHLHFEMRKGDYNNPKGWWGLMPIDPFSQSENC
jgi:murein DD-endopeptidase MepM/ murein hydrolase activator NlpD